MDPPNQVLVWSGPTEGPQYNIWTILQHFLTLSENTLCFWHVEGGGIMMNTFLHILTQNIIRVRINSHNFTSRPE